jgi:hypothetical protein
MVNVRRIPLQDRCFYWESVVMLRKLGMSCVVVFLGAISVQVRASLCVSH